MAAAVGRVAARHLDAFCDHLDALSAACCAASLSHHEGSGTHTVLACSHARLVSLSCTGSDPCAQVCPRACAAGRARAPPLLSHVSKTHMEGLCSPAGVSRQTGIFRVRYIPFMVGGRQGYGGMLCRAATRPSTVYGGMPVGLFGHPIIP